MKTKAIITALILTSSDLSAGGRGDWPNKEDLVPIAKDYWVDIPGMGRMNSPDGMMVSFNIVTIVEGAFARYRYNVFCQSGETSITEASIMEKDGSIKDTGPLGIKSLNTMSMLRSGSMLHLAAEKACAFALVKNKEDIAKKPRNLGESAAARYGEMRPHFFRNCSEAGRTPPPTML